MEYKYCNNENFEDYASGRVLYSAEGVPNFPVRLINEIFGYALEYSSKKHDLCVYDPCCGGGYSLTVLGYWHQDVVAKLYGSDIDAKMVETAKKNLALLGSEGLDRRYTELKSLHEMYGKESHREAMRSLERLRNKLTANIPSEIFEADCTKALPHISPDIIITDIPYGNLVDWNGDSSNPLQDMLQQLAAISHRDTVLAVSMDKKQSIEHPSWIRKKKQLIGKRKFEIYVHDIAVLS